MDHFIKIYTQKAQQYHQMIAAEDIDNNILRELETITDLREKRIVDLGSGTGRLPILFKDLDTQIIALDLYMAMLLEQSIQREACNGDWHIIQGDMHDLPLPDHMADVVTAGWALGHFTGWYQMDWSLHIDQALTEMQRLAKPGGVLIIMETLGTGSLEPAPPTQTLADYYTHLEGKWGFTRKVIKTDYLFDSPEDAVQKSGFFFGTELSEKIITQNWARLPEWTGIWYRKL